MAGCASSGTAGRLPLVFFVVAFGVGGAMSAGAVPLLRIEMNVVGGTFSEYGAASGPITSGTIAWLAPGGGVETPFATALAGGEPAGFFTHFTLAGPSGFFSIPFSVRVDSVQIFPDFFIIDGFAFGPAGPFSVRSGASSAGAVLRTAGMVAPAVHWATGVFCPSPPCGGGDVSGNWVVPTASGGTATTAVTHDFEIGSEVSRTYAPEPGSGPLVGLGLAAVLLAGALRPRGTRLDRASVR